MTTCIGHNRSLQLDTKQCIQKEMLETIGFIESYISAVNLCKPDLYIGCYDDEQRAYLNDRVAINLCWMNQQLNNLKQLSTKIAN
jgi:hypothetical protein